MKVQNRKLRGSVRLRVLLINFDERNSSLISGVLNEYEMFYAENFTKALVLAKENTPALLIINSGPEEGDFRMQLKKCYRTSRIPVLAIIKKNEINAQSISLLPRWDDFIQSPFEELELLLRVRIMLLNMIHFHERYVNFQPEANSETTGEFFVKRIKDIVEENLDNHRLSVADVSREAGVSQPQLYRKLIALTGLSPNSYIRHIRLTYAARFLADGAGNVGEIAFRVGFSSQSYFTKCFKATHRYKPKQVLRECPAGVINYSDRSY